MKRIGIILLLFISLKSMGQTTGHLRFDTVRIYKQGGTAELYLINSTKDSLGVLTNVGGGLTRFLKSRMLNDSVLVVGRDTLTIVGNLDRIQAANGLTKSGNTILFGGVLDQATNLYFNGFDAKFLNGASGTNTHHNFTGTGNAHLALDPLGNQTKVGIGTASPTVKFDVNGIGLIRDPSVGFEFSGWPTSYNTGFNHNVLGVYGDEPSLDILIDSGSQFQIGGLTFRTLKDAAPKLPTTRFGFGAGGKIEYNAFINGLAWTSTMEFYLGDRDNTTIHVFAISGEGTHFFGNRKVFTAESKEALMFGTAIRGVNSTQISALTDTTYFAGDAGNKPLWWFNMPLQVPDTTNYKPIVQHVSNGSVYRSYWPATGGGGGGGTPGGSGAELQYRIDATTFGGGAGTSWDNTNSGLTINKTGLGVTQNNSAGYILSNTTAAAAGAQQISPAIRWLGNGWKTNATAASQAVEFRSYVLPIQGAANPTGTWNLQSSVNGGAFADRLTVNTGGDVTVSGRLLFSPDNTHTIGASGANRPSTVFTGNLSMFSAMWAESGIFDIRGPSGGSGVTLIRFRGVTTSFPALTNNGGNWVARLADNSANTDVEVLDEPYSESTYNGSNEVPTKNAIRDEIETFRYKPYSQTASLVASTADATPTNMSVLYGLTTLPNNSNGWFKVTLTGNGQSGASTHSIHGIKYYSFHKNGGTLTLDAADVIVTDKKGGSVSTASWQVIVSSNQPVLEVTGVTAITMVWGAAVEIVYVVEN